LAACAPARESLLAVTSVSDSAQVERSPTQPPAIPADTAPEKAVSGWAVEAVVGGLTVPWSVVFPAENRILIAERGGSIREVIDGEMAADPLYVVPDVAGTDEDGLMGMALDPHYTDNRLLVACYAYLKGNQTFNRVIRLRDEGSALAKDGVILEEIPSARYHAGCRTRFGPDGRLYITTGDALTPEAAQDAESLAGKILRINPDGSIPADNPFPGSPVFSLGHRNPQGLDWHPDTGSLYATEHGPSGFDGPPGGDEINLIKPGGNYGWPLVSHDEALAGTQPPLVQFTPAEAPASARFYDSDVLPMFTGDFFFGALRGEGLVRVRIDPAHPAMVEQVEKIVDDVGRVRDVAVGPDGLIYFTTSNMDGRGTPIDGDDHLYRIVPVYE